MVLVQLCNVSCYLWMVALSAEGQIQGSGVAGHFPSRDTAWYSQCFRALLAFIRISVAEERRYPHQKKHVSRLNPCLLLLFRHSRMLLAVGDSSPTHRPKSQQVFVKQKAWDLPNPCTVWSYTMWLHWPYLTFPGQVKNCFFHIHFFSSYLWTTKCQQSA